MNLPPGPVEADHLAEAVPEMVPVGLRQVIERMLVHIEAAGGDRVQQRFPQMRPRLLHQDDAGLPALAERVAQPRHEFQPARAAADDDDLVAPALIARREQRCIELVLLRRLCEPRFHVNPPLRGAARRRQC